MAYISKENTRDGVKPIGSNLYGTCTSDADDTTKIVAMPDFDVLTEGVTVYVHFQDENSAATPLLKVGSTVAKSIIYNGTQSGSWEANSFVAFTYYQNSWHQSTASGVDSITNSDIENIVNL